MKTSSQVIQDLQNSCATEVGIAYCYIGPISLECVIPTWIFQLALQCSCVPLESGRDTVLQEKLPADSSDEQWNDWYRRRHESLLQALFSILPNFRRTYIILDGFVRGEPLPDQRRQRLKEHELNNIPSLLEQDFGNVSIAVFARDYDIQTPLLSWPTSPFAY